MFRGLIPLIAALAFAAPADAKGFHIARTGVYALSTDLLVRAMAKELCSCWHVSRVGEGGPIARGVEMCLERAQLPLTPGLIRRFANVEVGDDQDTFEVDATFLGALVGLFRGDNALARFDPEEPRYGCRLLPDDGR